MKKLGIVTGMMLIGSSMLFAQTNYTHLAELDETIYSSCLVSSVTNGWCSNTGSIPDSVEYMIENGTLTNVIQRLAKEGHICAVLGHNWREGRPREGEGSAYGGWFADYHPGISYRTCRTCGKSESKGTSEWK